MVVLFCFLFFLCPLVICLVSVYFCLNFVISFLFLNFRLCLSFFILVNAGIIWDLFIFLYLFIAINFSPKNCFAATYRSWCVCDSVFICFEGVYYLFVLFLFLLFFLFGCLPFRVVLVSCHMVLDCSAFLPLVSNVIALTWLVISIFLNCWSEFCTNAIYCL